MTISIAGLFLAILVAPQECPPPADATVTAQASSPRVQGWAARVRAARWPADVPPGPYRGIDLDRDQPTSPPQPPVAPPMTASDVPPAASQPSVAALPAAAPEPPPPPAQVAMVPLSLPANPLPVTAPPDLVPIPSVIIDAPSVAAPAASVPTPALAYPALLPVIAPQAAIAAPAAAPPQPSYSSPPIIFPEWGLRVGFGHIPLFPLFRKPEPIVAKAAAPEPAPRRPSPPRQERKPLKPPVSSDGPAPEGGVWRDTVFGPARS